MSKLERCKACRGSKYVLGMGAMKKDCKACNKTGFVEIDTAQNEEEFLSNKSNSLTNDNNKESIKIDKRSKEYRNQLKKSV